MIEPVVLALGGGGARGFAHIGVLRVLEREKIPVKAIVGTSMGAMIGAMYAHTPSADFVENKVRAMLNNKRFTSNILEHVEKNSVRRGWFDPIESENGELVIKIKKNKISELSGDKIFDMLDLLLPDHNFESNKIPFATVASDIMTGEEVIFQQGSVKKAVAASASLPGILPPFVINNHTLVDGAATSPVPVIAAQTLYNEKIVAVDVSSSLYKNPRLDNILSIIIRNFYLTVRKHHDELVKRADILIQPDVGTHHWSDFEKIDFFIKSGEDAAILKINEIIQVK